MPVFPKLLNALCLSGIVVLYSCQNNTKNDESAPLFELLSAEKTHVNFNNEIIENAKANIMSYQYFYNGGGVSVGDLNDDGLDDIYFSGNMTPAKLYLNKGNMEFEDVSEKAGIVETGFSWKTGVTFADVNGDGKLDIYQCRSGALSPENRENKLFINQGNNAQGIPTFTEQSKAYGLADDAYSTQAVFFDYDKDNDLDMFLLNHNPKVFTTLDEQSAAVVLKEPAPTIRIKLYKNTGNKFTDASDAAGIYNSSFTYGLGGGIADINNDGWPDIYISNDYSSPDYLYINNGDGTFTDRIQAHIGHTSLYSMGNDVADINNDALPDILTLDMLPEDNHRQKQLFMPDNYEYNNLRIKLGFHQQDMRNMLQVNNGDGTFSEIGQLSGISNTDWSWAPLFADFDNDGWKDLFVSNGYLRDYTDQDFLKFKGDFLRQTDPNTVKANILNLIDNIPSSNVNNYVFQNNKELGFSNKGAAWGINTPSNSNGAAYADLDNDGDLDLIINNINLPAFIYQNKAAERGDSQYLRLKLKGNTGNTQGVGAKIWLYSKGAMQYLEQNPSRGYQSSVSPVLHFGLGQTPQVDSLRIVWNSGKQEVLKAVKANQLLTLEEKNATQNYIKPVAKPALFIEANSPVDFNQLKNNINDFKRQPLITNPLSFNGPCMIQGDVNGDGLEDVFVGAGQGQSSALYIQQKGGTFTYRPSPAFQKDAQSEDVDAVFLDANGDGYQDLYVASGGYANYLVNDPLFQDRLYLNDGKGNFRKSTTTLPQMLSSKSCVTAADFNGDGHPDLFVGSRVVPGRYPEAPQSYLLINDGKGNFTDQIVGIAPQLQKAGMVTDAQWVDLNGDQKQDLVVIGEWMPVTAMINENGKLKDQTKTYFGKTYTGWWNKLLVEDLNGDGFPDLVIGNTGLNTQCKASDTEPAELYYKDFDDNGAVDPVLCFYIKGKSYPYVSRDELLEQISMMRNRYEDYKSYADGTIKDIFTAEELKDAVTLKANYLKTALFLNTGKGSFKEVQLPVQAQYAPVYAIKAIDADKDGHKDLLLCGNVNHARLKFGNNDANFGVLLKVDKKGGYNYVPQLQSGFHFKGDVRSIIQVNDKLLFGINQSKIIAYQMQ
ncbi:MAG: VCBS repeat-containing protein [Bacteroidota bacterium]